MTIEDDTKKFWCGTKVLESPLKGTQIVNWGHKIDNSHGTDHPKNENVSKPTLTSQNCDIFVLTILLYEGYWKKKFKAEK